MLIHTGKVRHEVMATALETETVQSAKWYQMYSVTCYIETNMGHYPDIAEINTISFSYLQELINGVGVRPTNMNLKLAETDWLSLLIATLFQKPFQTKGNRFFAFMFSKVYSDTR